MLSRLLFRAGSSSSGQKLELPLSPVTIFVGPNNGGKSLALREIERWVVQVSPPTGEKVIEKLGFERWEISDLEKEIAKIKIEPDASASIPPNFILIGKPSLQANAPTRYQVREDWLREKAQNPDTPPRNGYSDFLALFTLKLDGATRLKLTDPQPAADLIKKIAPNHLAHLFHDNEARAKVRRIVHEAFGRYLVIDPTDMGKLRLRLSPQEPVNEQEERGWYSAAVEFHGKAMLIDDTSDGVKAFVGILTALMASEPKIALIDEPEAFLPPPLCTKIGKEITSMFTGTNRRLFAATHSANFIMGCIQGGAPVNIVRLTYDYSTATARLLEKEKLTKLMRNPLLRSIGVLNALFYNAVIVTEADADRAFYQEINERLISEKDPRGIEGCLFLNAQNKQTVWDIVKPLRELGIPAAGIVDIDVLKEGGNVWKKPMEGAFVPEKIRQGFGTDRANLLGAFNDRKMKRGGGIEILPQDDKDACSDFFDRLSSYGIFVVPNGELEAWLPDLKVNLNKGAWLTSIFEKMGEDPEAEDYIRPSSGDVWDFIGSIKKWISDPKRKGIPE